MGLCQNIDSMYEEYVQILNSESNFMGYVRIDQNIVVYSASCLCVYVYTRLFAFAMPDAMISGLLEQLSHN